MLLHNAICSLPVCKLHVSFLDVCRGADRICIPLLRAVVAIAESSFGGVFTAWIALQAAC